MILKIGKGKLLVASLLVNALFVGYFSSFAFKPMFFHRMGPPPKMGMMPFDNIEREARGLPEKYKTHIVALANDKKSEAKEHMENMEQLIGEMFSQFTAEKFDSDKIMEIESKLSEEDQILKSTLLSFMVSVAKTLPDEDRIKFFRHVLPPPDSIIMNRKHAIAGKAPHEMMDDAKHDHMLPPPPPPINK